jgi:hypothetical protein
MWILQTVAFFLLAIGVHVILCRLVRPEAALENFLFVGTLAGAALAVRVYGSGVETVASLLVYAFACEFYIFLFSMVSSSISVSLLLTLRPGRVTDDQLPVLYSSSGMISRRLEKLVAAGLLSQNDGKHLITDKGQRLIGTFYRLRSFFGHPAH